MKRVLVTLFVLAICRSAAGLFNATSARDLDCPEEGQQLTDLGPRCGPLEVYNPLEWTRMAPEESRFLARHCACKLVNLDWEAIYDEHPAMRRVYLMIKGLLTTNKYRHKQPPQLWSDIDVVVNGYSIALSTREYLKRRKQDPNVAFFKDADFEKELHLCDIRYVCRLVARDKQSYYQYLENLQRISPPLFFKVLEMNDFINMVYQASKVCKLFILHRLDEFMKKPTTSDYFIIDKARLRASDLDDLNEIQQDANIDSLIRDLSYRLFNCQHWHEDELSLETLESECPMMISESLPENWINEHLEPGQRSRVALECGCKLLALNSSWAHIIKDPNLSVMSRALTGYMGQNAPSSLGAKFDSNTWEYSAWFDQVMEKFVKSKKLAIKEIVKINQGSSDPTNEINRLTGDEERALKLLRLGCNRLMLNHIKGSARGDPIRPIKYLDNLRHISQDPLFVFHLTLLDANLFKLHALSKMCQPVVS